MSATISKEDLEFIKKRTIARFTHHVNNCKSFQHLKTIAFPFVVLAMYDYEIRKEVKAQQIKRLKKARKNWQEGRARL